jgi:hypothetical protein
LIYVKDRRGIFLKIDVWPTTAATMPVRAGVAVSQGRGASMAAENSQSGQGQATGGGAPAGRVPMMQRVLDNPFLLLFLGVVMPTVFYLIWGVMELTQIPIAE